MQAYNFTLLQRQLTTKERALMVLCPCTYLNVPHIATRDCCFCCHERPKYQLLHIPPFVETAGTCLTHSNPINIYFIIFRFIALLYAIFVCIFSFVVYTIDHSAKYWFMYWTEWLLICSVILSILRFLSSYTVYTKITKHELDIDELYTYDTDDIDIDTKLWILYKYHKIALQITLPATAMIVINYWLFVYSGAGHFGTRLDEISSYQKHGILAVVLWIDFLISTERIYYKSAIWSILLGTIYTIWTIIFEIFINDINGKEYIYSTYNWSQSITTPTLYYFISLIILTILTMLATFIKNIILIYSGSRKIVQTQTHDESVEEPLAQL